MSFCWYSWKASPKIFAPSLRSGFCGRGAGGQRLWHWGHSTNGVRPWHILRSQQFSHVRRVCRWYLPGRFRLDSVQAVHVWQLLR